MFIDDKGAKRICFENKDKYKFFMKNTFKELTSFFINFFQNYNEDIHFLNVEKGKWILKIKFNTQINSSISELIIYKLGNSNKYIICFNFLEGNKISFIRMIKSLYNINCN